MRAGAASRDSIRESHRLAEFRILMHYHCAAAILNLFPNIGEQLDFNDQNYLQSLAQPSRWPENYFRKISENPPDKRLTRLNTTILMKGIFNAKTNYHPDGSRSS
jgi:hypothetical protein